MHLTKLRNIAAVVALQALIAGCGGGGSDSAATPPPVPTPTPLPVISAQPVNASVLTDGVASFSVTATGSGLSYQWRKNGSAIVGATATSYTAAPASYGDSGAQYTVVVSNAGGNVVSSVAQLTLMLSTNQQAFESLILTPSAGSYLLHWNLNYSGPETSGTNYAYSDFSVLANSPLTQGPQTKAQSAPQNLATNLVLVTAGPTRILKNGVILVVPSTSASSTLSYTGSDVKVDSLAADNTTVAFTQVRSGYTSVALSGNVIAAPADFAHWHNSFFSNAAILNPSATFAAGASYLKFTATNQGDRYNAFDCTSGTLDANITPCVSATTLTAALNAGISSASDATTYHLADGSVSTVGGVSVWVATAPRPQSGTLSTTVQYRTYFERNGNVYTGALIKDGAVLGGSYYVSNPTALAPVDRLTFLPFHIRMNKAAHDSVAAALAI